VSVITGKENRAGLSAFFVPASIAVVGASPTSMIASRVHSSLRSFGYAGPIIPVNPKYPEVWGQECYPSVQDIPDVVDLVLVSTPADTVPAVVRQASSRGIRGVMVYSSGFGEAGGMGRRLQGELVTSAAGNTRVLGPNCQGLIDVRAKVCSNWSARIAKRLQEIEPGHVAWLSQSGAMASMATSRLLALGVRLSHVANTGNEADVDFADMVQYLAAQDDVRIIAGYIEEIRRPQEFRRAVEEARSAGKACILLKGGVTDSGGRATQSHTGSLAGPRVLYEQYLEQVGVILTSDLDDLTATVQYMSVRNRAASARTAPGSPRVAILTNSGGLGVQLADLCEESGLTVPAVPPDGVAQIRDHVAEFSPADNPVDLNAYGWSDAERVGDVLTALNRWVRYDLLLIGMGAIRPKGDSSVGDAVRRLCEAFLAHAPETMIICLEGTEAVAEAAQPLGIPVFGDLRRGIAAYRRGQPGARLAEGGTGGERERSTLAPARALEPVSEWEAKLRLRRSGLPVPRSVLIRAEGSDMTSEIADLAFPVAVKIVAPSLLHKSAAGCVVLNVTSPQELQTSAAVIRRRAALALEDAGHVDGVLVEEMAGPGEEVIVSWRRDELFGPVLLIGAGGKYAEVYGDISLGVLPLTGAEVRNMITRLRWFRVLRDKDIDALVSTALALAQAAESWIGLAELEVNPVIVGDVGEGCWIVDAVAHVEPSGRRTDG
jgi:acetate---CoA ligase (ADP-forming)